MSSGWIGVDLDGTLAKYDEWRGLTHIGEPIFPMVQRIRIWLNEGKEVRIFTARMADPDAHLFVDALHDWLYVLNIGPLGATNVKDFQMIELWDDRAVQVIPNTGMRADGSTA
ncbi:hypothetical protein ACQZ6C_10695 [Rhizobium rhizogenes]